MTTAFLLFILAPISITLIAGGTAGYIQATREADVADAEQTLRAIAHRGGVSEPIPFATSAARVNAPGLVEVRPQRERIEEAISPFPTALPRPASVEKPLPQAVPPAAAIAEALVQLPIDFAEEPTDDEAAIVVGRWENGESMTKTILNVWGIRAGGGNTYKLARSRYKNYLTGLSQ